MTAAWMRQILERYGQKVTVQAGESTVSVRAFLQPDRKLLDMGLIRKEEGGSRNTHYSLLLE